MPVNVMSVHSTQQLRLPVDRHCCTCLCELDYLATPRVLCTQTGGTTQTLLIGFRKTCLFFLFNAEAFLSAVVGSLYDV